MSGLLDSMSGWFSSWCSQALSPTREVEKVIFREVDTMFHTRCFVRVAGLSGALAVVLAAYGSHGFNESNADPRLKRVFYTANKIHFLHTLALLASPLTNRPFMVGTLLVTGIVVFSGSCYIHALTGSPIARAITPYGGMILIFSWLAMVL